jgi:hypothetical protein
MKEQCEACKGYGFIISTVSGSAYVPDGTIEIERCDECSDLKDDVDAIPLARAAGIEVSDDGRVSLKETRRWERIQYGQYGRSWRR